MVGIISDFVIHYPIGSRIKVGQNCGTVKYVGEIANYAGVWLGIEWDDPQRGKHDGSVDGKRYFRTSNPTNGSFIRPERIASCISLEEAIRERYLNYDSSILDASSMREAQTKMQASFFEVVGMEKLARKQSKFEELVEVSASGTLVNSAGYLKDFTKLRVLNLDHTLIWNWITAADVAFQLPNLVHLDLSSNRLVQPSEQQISEFQPAFNNLKHINLSNCGYTEWKDVTHVARLWPEIQSFALQKNDIKFLSKVNTNEIFKNLKELDLQLMNIVDFDKICKLGNIDTLVSLNLNCNGIEEIKLPDCEPNEKLNIFVSLEQLNIFQNPIWNESEAFNELDKLPKLKRLNITPHLKSNFEEMFSKAVASIIGLEFVNKVAVSSEERRGAEYELWKKYAREWLLALNSTESLTSFYKRHRSYAVLIKKYGSPADFVPLKKTIISNIVRIFIKDTETGEIWEKKLPRMITIQTLQGLILKRFKKAQCQPPQLSYTDPLHPEHIILLDNSSKTLDFYSIRDNDTVNVKW